MDLQQVPAWIQIVVSVVGAVIGAYAATKNELGYLRKGLERVESASDEAHRRIDDILMKGQK